MAKSRRKAREAALQTLYEIEVGGKAQEANALSNTLEVSGLSEELAEYATRLTEGILSHKTELDEKISAAVQGYDYDRLAAVDRNILRVAAYELYYEPDVPPKVTINEAIEIAKKYSTAESGRFVNGVLGNVVRQSPKAQWDPSSAPAGDEPESVVRDTPVEPEVETLEAGSEEAQRLAKVGGWKLRNED
ncbi:MAG: transcription antitermination protein NusB [Fimbriimonadaceae bacterium]|jgi:N utilization substance protein B|nr:transcription antitermination protein NusB [Fimbriimonadaceae bacterium]